ncbi:MAG TPA: hypothetical protein PLG21_10255 [Anaerolineae bacterium]|nr:hypothetical protein [Anaerolineae bacterium]
MGAAKYHRVLLKLSGEFLAGETGFGIDPDLAEAIAAQIGPLVKMDVQVAIVIGAGNI